MKDTKMDLGTRWLGLELPHPFMPGASPPLVSTPIRCVGAANIEGLLFPGWVRVDPC